MLHCGSTLRSLPRTGFLAAVGFGLLLLPLVPTWAQAPPTKQGKDIEIQLRVQGQKQVTPSDLDRDLTQAARARLAAEEQALVQQDLEKQRHDLEMALKDLQKRIEALRAKAKVPGEGKPQTGSGAGLTIPAQKPGGPVLGAGSSAGTSKPASVEQRLEKVEKKLDILLWEITNLRRDMGKGASGGGSSTPMMPPGFAPGKAAPGGTPGGAPGGPPGGGRPGFGPGGPGPGLPGGSGGGTAPGVPDAPTPPGTGGGSAPGVPSLPGTGGATPPVPSTAPPVPPSGSLPK
jgi:hypothetical protein